MDGPAYSRSDRRTLARDRRGAVLCSISRRATQVKITCPRRARSGSASGCAAARTDPVTGL